MNVYKIPFVLIISLLLAGCAGMTQTQQRTVTGGLGGAGLGAAIGALSGNAAMGAAIGAASGVVGGYLYGEHKEAEQRAYDRGRQDAFRQQQEQYRYR